MKGDGRSDDSVVAGTNDDASPRVMRLRRIGAILWPSFFAAAVATFVFFAIVDPSELAEITWPHVAISRKLGYSIGFFMFWACTLGACTFTTLLLSVQARRACVECRSTDTGSGQ